MKNEFDNLRKNEFVIEKKKSWYKGGQRRKQSQSKEGTQTGPSTTALLSYCLRYIVHAIIHYVPGTYVITVLGLVTRKQRNKKELKKRRDPEIVTRGFCCFIDFERLCGNLIGRNVGLYRCLKTQELAGCFSYGLSAINLSRICVLIQMDDWE